MRLFWGLTLAVALASFGVASAQQDASRSRIARMNFSPFDVSAFGFASLEQLADQDVVRAALFQGEWGPWIAVSIERNAKGETTLSTSVPVDPPLWFRPPRPPIAIGQSVSIVPVQSPTVIRTAVLGREASDRFFAAASALRAPAEEAECNDRGVQVRLRNQAPITRCDDDAAGALVRAMFDLAEAQQPECAPLARRIDAGVLTSCHAISGDIRAGASAQMMSRRLFFFRRDPSARSREGMIEPGVHFDWQGRILKGPAALGRQLDDIERSHAYTWDQVEQQVIGTSAETVLVRGFLVRIAKGRGSRMFAPFEQTWVKDRSSGWRLRSWIVKPLRNCDLGTRSC